MTTLDALQIRRRLGRKTWGAPAPFGPDGWVYASLDGDGLIIVTSADVPGIDCDAVHASISRPDRDPTYADLKALHLAVWGGTGWAIQVFAPDTDHVNIHEHALHLWGRLDGARLHPDFTYGLGTI